MQNNNSCCCIVLAAGEGTRMRTQMPKVLTQVLFSPMLKWVIDCIEEVNIPRTAFVLGYKHGLIEEYLKNFSYPFKSYLQKERKGSAHAVGCAEEFLLQNVGRDVLVLCGDVPLLDSKTIKEALAQHKADKNAATVISANLLKPFGYGRIVREENGDIKQIIEEKDACQQVAKITEINSGAYWFNVEELLAVLPQIKNENSQNEYYLTDAISILLSNSKKVGCLLSCKENIALGANTKNDLDEINEIARKMVLDKLEKLGVNIPCRNGIIIQKDVFISKGTTVLPGTIILDKTVVGKNCTIGPNTYIKNCVIDDSVNLPCCYCADSSILRDTNMSPFSSVCKG